MLNQRIGFTFFTGEADSRRDEAVEALIACFIDPAFAEFDLEFIDAEVASASQILSAVSTVPFASARKVVVAEHVDLLSADDQLKIADFLPKLSQRSCLILLTSEKEVATKSRGKAKEKAQRKQRVRERHQRRGFSQNFGRQ